MSSPLAAVVVNRDAGALLIECIESLRAAGVDEIVVVDNASSDGSLQRLAERDARTRLIPTGHNRGYGAAANRGVASTEAPVVLVCNPDLVVDPDAPARLVAALDARDDLAACGPQILDSNLVRYPSARRFPSYGLAALHAALGMFAPNNRWSRRYRNENGAIPDEVDWISGACMAIRRVAFDSVGGFDEGYFMYVEDLDLCWRLRRAGWSVGYVDAARVTHVQGASTRRAPVRMLLAHHRSTWRFAKKSMRGRERLLLPAVAFGLGARFVTAAARETLSGHRPGRRRA
jgi:N-acetylglucosaminyl-diphospho-decaprenol L-rhamnosyltransferase